MITRGRVTRAVQAFTNGQVSAVGPGHFEVKSQHAAITYNVVVDEESDSCSCPWGEHSPGDWSDPCYHALAAAIAADIKIPAEGAEPGLFENEGE